jgi:hypothetical protein
MRNRLVSKSLSGLAAVALLGIVAAPSFAVPIEFTHKAAANGSGTVTLNDVPFGGVGFTITATGDTDDRVSFGSGFFIDHLTASIFIPSVGTFDFLTPTRTFVNNAVGEAGFSRAGASGADLFDGPANDVFKTWDMLTAIGPINGDGELLQWSSEVFPINTSGGVLVFDDDTRNAQFRATVERVVVVPEPGMLSLLGLALAASGWMRRKALS